MDTQNCTALSLLRINSLFKNSTPLNYFGLDNFSHLFILAQHHTSDSTMVLLMRLSITNNTFFYPDCSDVAVCLCITNYWCPAQRKQLT